MGIIGPLGSALNGIGTGFEQGIKNVRDFRSMQDEQDKREEWMAGKDLRVKQRDYQTAQVNADSANLASKEQALNAKVDPQRVEEFISVYPKEMQATLRGQLDGADTVRDLQTRMKVLAENEGSKKILADGAAAYMQQKLAQREIAALEEYNKAMKAANGDAQLEAVAKRNLANTHEQNKAAAGQLEKIVKNNATKEEVARIIKTEPNSVLAKKLQGITDMEMARDLIKAHSGPHKTAEEALVNQAGGATEVLQAKERIARIKANAPGADGTSSKTIKVGPAEYKLLFHHVATGMMTPDQKKQYSAASMIGQTDPVDFLSTKQRIIAVRAVAEAADVVAKTKSVPNGMEVLTRILNNPAEYKRLLEGGAPAAENSSRAGEFHISVPPKVLDEIKKDGGVCKDERFLEDVKLAALQSSGGDVNAATKAYMEMCANAGITNHLKSFDEIATTEKFFYQPKTEATTPAPKSGTPVPKGAVAEAVGRKIAQPSVPSFPSKQAAMNHLQQNFAKMNPVTAFKIMRAHGITLSELRALVSGPHGATKSY